MCKSIIYIILIIILLCVQLRACCLTERKLNSGMMFITELEVHILYTVAEMVKDTNVSKISKCIKYIYLVFYLLNKL